MHDWQVITYMNDVTDMVRENDDIWVATSGGAYRFDSADSSATTFTNLDGLGSLNLSALTIDHYDRVIAGCADGTINRFNPASGIWTVYRNLEGQAIVDIFSDADTLWAATHEGVAVYLIRENNLEFRDFYNNLPVQPGVASSIAVYNQRIYFATQNGLLYAPSDFIKNNLKISNAWRVLTTANGLPYNAILDLAIQSDTLYIGTGNGMAFINRNNQLSNMTSWTSGQVSKILFSDSHRYLIRNRDIFFWQNGHWTYTSSEENLIKAGVIDQAGTVWLGLEKNGIKKFGQEKGFLVDGPATNHLGYLIKDKSGKLWISSGKFKLSFNEGFYTYDFHQWTNYKFFDGTWNRKNSMATVYEDATGKIWFGAWGGGTVSIKDGVMDFYHQWPEAGRMVISTRDGVEEIVIPEISADKADCLAGADVSVPYYTVITHFNEDAAGNLWCANYLSADLNYVAVMPMNSQGEYETDCAQWRYFGANIGLSRSESELSSLEFDAWGRLWMGTFEQGIQVFDYNGTIDNPGDDEPLIRLRTSNTNIYSNTILCLKNDLDGTMWIGTSGGLSSFDGSNFYKHVGDIGPVENKINQIFVDDFNNKWFATDGGMSILKADGSPWDPGSWMHYTPENSGLPSKIVNSIFVDNKAGEAYIGTEGGLCIFSGPIAEYKKDLQTVAGGPSPFILDGSSNYVLKNLVFGASVKILNINGKQVRLLSSENGGVEGGRATWDGKDENNNYVASGIYIYLVFGDEGISGNGKIAVVKP